MEERSYLYLFSLFFLDYKVLCLIKKIRVFIPISKCSFFPSWNFFLFRFIIIPLHAILSSILSSANLHAVVSHAHCESLLLLL